jgi:DNA polymerase III epsilon subunit-like protein
MDSFSRAHVVHNSLFNDNPLRDFIFLDYEATGLLVPTNPIEIGIAMADGYAESFLIKPSPVWEQVNWHPEAIRIHGLTPKDVEAGTECEVIAHWLNNLCRGKIVISDNPEYEKYWTNRIFLATDIKSELEIYHFKPIINEVLSISKLPERQFQKNIRDIEVNFKVTHRALDDALFWAMVFRGATTYPYSHRPDVPFRAGV